MKKLKIEIDVTKLNSNELDKLLYAIQGSVFVYNQDNTVCEILSIELE